MLIVDSAVRARVLLLIVLATSGASAMGDAADPASLAASPGAESTSVADVQSEDLEAKRLIREADRIRAPNRPFRYTLTLVEMQSDKEISRQTLDVYMRFVKQDGPENGDARALVRFVAPERDVGKSLLSIFDKLWFYDPKLQRPIPISRAQRLIGQISNGDVVAADFDTSYFAKLLGKESCDGGTCAKIELTRRLPFVPYPKIDYWVDLVTFRPVRAEFRSTTGTLLKTAIFKDYRPALGRDRPHEIVVVDGLLKDHYSRMIYSDARFDTLPDQFFQREYLSRVR